MAAKLRVYAGELGWMDCAHIIAGWNGRLEGIPTVMDLNLLQSLPLDFVIESKLTNFCITEPGYPDEYFMAGIEKLSNFNYRLTVSFEPAH